MNTRRFWLYFAILFAQFCLAIGMGSNYLATAKQEPPSALSPTEKKQLTDDQRHIEQLSEIKFSYKDQILIIPTQELQLKVDFTQIKELMMDGKTIGMEPFSFDQHVLGAKLNEWAKSIQSSPLNASIKWSDQGSEIIPEQAGMELDITATIKAFENELIHFNLFDPIPAVTLSIKPALTADMLKEMDQKLVTYTTEYDSTKEDRAHNVELAAHRLNGTILAPDESLSFVKKTGPYTIEEGYHLAPVMQDYSFEEGAGGGVCQVASTLYMVALNSQLEIVERHHHQRPVSYTPLGYDATVNQDKLDLQLKNPYDFPIYIQAVADQGKVTITLFGKEVQNQPLSYLEESDTTELAYEVIFQADADIPLGKPEIKKQGHVGYRIKINRVTVTNGVEKKELVSEDTYVPITEIIIHNPKENLDELKKKYRSPGELG